MSIYKNFALTRKAASNPILCPLASGIWASSVEHEAQRRLLIRIGLVAPGSAGNAPTVTDRFGYPYIKGARDFD
jgi:hypothetical protein